MMNKGRSAATAAAIAVSGLVASTAPAQAYEVDCAIMLCLAGGWPDSAPCAEAWAVFIQRITPWPIEPPLQIWRCPLGVSFEGSAPVAPLERLTDIAFRPAPSISPQPNPSPIQPVQSAGQADIDISGEAFDFVRSIRVFHIDFGQRESEEGNCIRSDATRLGSYGVQGDFHWTGSSVGDVPPASALPHRSDCAWVNYRAVFVEWCDHAGNYGFEEVHY